VSGRASCGNSTAWTAAPESRSLTTRSTLSPSGTTSTDRRTASDFLDPSAVTVTACFPGRVARMRKRTAVTAPGARSSDRVSPCGSASANQSSCRSVSFTVCGVLR
jgi:hypothetical protein